MGGGGDDTTVHLVAGLIDRSLALACGCMWVLISVCVGTDKCTNVCVCA